ncbi:MAG: OmpA family protein [Cytophagales bacterium]|nr:OmpA family protein [Cytophagales bacterium]
MAINVLYAQTADITFVKPEKLNANINSACDESTPIIINNGKAMYFTRNMCDKNIGGAKAGADVWYADKDENDNWKPAIRFKAPINNAMDNIVGAVSSSGDTLYIQNVYKKDGKMQPGISMSIRKDTTWTLPTALDIKNLKPKRNSPFGFSVSPNGKHLLISRYRKDSTDAEDLFVCHKSADGKWGDMIHLGTDINSEGFETSPYLAHDDSTLYFASNGFGGYGDADIFVSKRLDDTWAKWSKPQNLGQDINTKGFDGYFTIMPNGVAYYTSGDDPSAFSDLYVTQKLRPYSYINVTIKDKKTGSPITVATVTCGLRDNNEIISKSVTADASNKIKINYLPKKYYFVAHAEGYIAIDEDFEVTTPLINRDTSYTIMLAPIEVGQTIRLNHIYFESGKATLLPESYIELDVLVELLQENPHMEILIAGHTDNKGNAKLNQKLSENRVKSVDIYLVQKGINIQRIKYKGYGMTKPIANNTTEEGRAKNRRVEFVILKK